MEERKWVFAYASAIGNGHIAEDIPCQDSCSVCSYPGFDIAIVSDGAGSCANSHIGSAQAVEFCNFQFAGLIKNKGWCADTVPELDEWHREAKGAFLKVRDDIEKYSLNSNLDFKSLSCTVIVVVAFEGGLLVSHIGDGRAGYCNRELEWKPMLTPFHGEEANQTVFITSYIWDDDVVDNFVRSTVIKDDVHAFCLMSDGCEKSAFECNIYDPAKEQYYDPNRPFPQFFNSNLKILTQLATEEKPQAEINELWKTFLAAGTDKLKIESDDKTLILAVRYP